MPSLLPQFLVTNNLEAYSQTFQDRGIEGLDALHTLALSSEPRVAFLSLGQECGMTTLEISRLFKAATDSAVQDEKETKQREAAKAKAKVRNWDVYQVYVDITQVFPLPAIRMNFITDFASLVTHSRPSGRPSGTQSARGSGRRRLTPSGDKWKSRQRSKKNAE